MNEDLKSAWLNALNSKETYEYDPPNQFCVIGQLYDTLRGFTSTSEGRRRKTTLASRAKLPNFVRSKLSRKKA